MSAALIAILDLLTRLEPGIAAVLVALLARLKDSIDAQTDQAVFLRVAGQVIVSMAMDTVLTTDEKKLAATEAIVNALSALQVPAPSLDVVEAFIALALTPPLPPTPPPPIVPPKGA